MGKKISEKRLINLMKRLTKDDCYISGGSPRMTHKERREIQDRLNTILMVERLYGAEPGGPTIVYPVDRVDFAYRVRRYILTGGSYEADGRTVKVTGRGPEGAKRPD